MKEIDTLMHFQTCNFNAIFSDLGPISKPGRSRKGYLLFLQCHSWFFHLNCFVSVGRSLNRPTLPSFSSLSFSFADVTCQTEILCSLNMTTPCVELATPHVKRHVCYTVSLAVAPWPLPQAPFCWEPRAIKGSVLQAWSRSEYCFDCFACCWEFLPS